MNTPESVKMNSLLEEARRKAVCCITKTEATIYQHYSDQAVVDRINIFDGYVALANPKDANSPPLRDLKILRDRLQKYLDCLEMADRRENLDPASKEVKGMEVGMIGGLVFGFLGGIFVADGLLGEYTSYAPIFRACRSFFGSLPYTVICYAGLPAATAAVSATVGHFLGRALTPVKFPELRETIADLTSMFSKLPHNSK